MPTVVLTRPSSVGIPGTITTGVSIPPLSTVVVDSCPCTDNLSLKWIYTLMDAVDEEVLTAEVIANHRYGSDPQWNRYGLVGDRIAHRIDVQVNANNLELHITNLSPTNTYTVNIVRIQILS